MAIGSQKLFIKIKNQDQTGNFCKLLKKNWRFAPGKPLRVGASTSAR
jgi:hypothetical protein